MRDDTEAGWSETGRKESEREGKKQGIENVEEDKRGRSLDILRIISYYRYVGNDIDFS